MSSTTVRTRHHRAGLAHLPVRGGAAGHSVRLTRRGRGLLLVALVVLLFAAFAAGRAASQAAGAREARPQVAQVTVQPGETLWSVARRVAPERDPRQVVTQLRQLNALPTAGLRAGQQLLLPATA